MRTHFGLLLGMKKVYDTYCYSERYITVPQKEEKKYTHLKKMRLMSIPKNKIEPLTTSDETVLGSQTKNKAREPRKKKLLVGRKDFKKRSRIS